MKHIKFFKRLNIRNEIIPKTPNQIKKGVKKLYPEKLLLYGAKKNDIKLVKKANKQIYKTYYKSKPLYLFDEANTAFYWAVKNKNKNIIKYLLQQNVNINCIFPEILKTDDLELLKISLDNAQFDWQRAREMKNELPSAIKNANNEQIKEILTDFYNTKYK